MAATVLIGICWFIHHIVFGRVRSLIDNSLFFSVIIKLAFDLRPPYQISDFPLLLLNHEFARNYCINHILFYGF